MKEVYQEYKDRVNFVWVYSREAHPEEFPFVNGFETKDLGWTHRYFRTTAMEQRAECARWIKSDLEPDAEMPMIIDYINNPLGPDNAIKNAYIGGGFYSGFVIDCDGKIVHQVSWAWRSPGGQWWGLPLAAADDLRAFLDAYLEEPPPCYTPPENEIAEPPADLVGDASILLVDDDAGAAYEGYFKIPLGNLKTHYRRWDVQAVGSPDLADLQGYNVVVWFTGDTAADTLTAGDQANLSAYLDGGGKLLISGQDIGRDISGTTFYHDYLHAELANDNVDATLLAGANILADVDITLGGSESAGNQLSPSQITPLDDAAGVFYYDGADATAWAGLRWSGDYQVVYFAFGFEGIGGRGAAKYRFKTMQRVLGWFGELPCRGDFGRDGVVDLDDLAILLGSYGLPMGQTYDTGDLSGDGDVDLEDLAALLGLYGTSCNQCVAT